MTELERERDRAPESIPCMIYREAPPLVNKSQEQIKIPVIKKVEKALFIKPTLPL